MLLRRTVVVKAGRGRGGVIARIVRLAARMSSMSVVTRRPRTALAMMAGLLDSALPDGRRDRLAEVADVIDWDPLESLTDDRAAEVLRDAEVLVGHWGCPTLNADVLELAPELRMFAYAAGTVKWQVTDAVWDRGLLVTSAAAANAVPVAEYTLAAILFANKGVFSFAALERDRQSLVPLPFERFGSVGRRVGLVGASHVGRLVIDLLAGHEMDVAVADPFLSDAEAARLGVRRMELDDLCAWCDVLSLHAPDIPETKHMIGAEQLALLQDGVTMINTARGALVDPDALIAELSTGRLAAVLDVTEPEPLPSDSVLRGLPNVVLTPHVAGAVGSELVRLADLAIDEIARYAGGEPPRYPVRREDLDRIA
jgi:phosphoglycerate dehydrogenase-like enzyme